MTPTPGTICRLAGWGATDKDGPNSIVLQRVNVNVIANNVCNGHQELNGLIVDGMVCADSYACQGDSGEDLFVMIVSVLLIFFFCKKIFLICFSCIWGCLLWKWL